MLYLAYGSNLNIEQMSYRCPNATVKDTLIIKDWKLVFRNFADIIPCKGELLYTGIWNITSKCEAALDRYEGIKTGLYSKRYFKYGGEEYLWYKMNANHISPPDEYYYSVIQEGYKDFYFPMKSLEAALDDSYEGKF